MLCLSHIHPYKPIVSKRLFCAILAKILRAAPAPSALPTVVINHQLDVLPYLGNSSVNQWLR